jgi:hypothetical protein
MVDWSEVLLEVLLEVLSGVWLEVWSAGLVECMVGGVDGEMVSGIRFVRKIARTINMIRFIRE